MKLRPVKAILATLVAVVVVVPAAGSAVRASSFQIVRVKSPPYVVENGPRGVIAISWSGQATFPVTMYDAPASCPASFRCASETNVAAQSSNPLRWAAWWCAGNTGAWTLDYWFWVTDSSGQTTQRIRAKVKCLPRAPVGGAKKPTPKPLPKTKPHGPTSSHAQVRCCFWLSVADDSYFDFGYNCGPGLNPPDVGCSLPNADAAITATWKADELVAYQEVLGGKPVLVRAPNPNAGARVKATWSEGARKSDVGGSTTCSHIVSTQPVDPDTIPTDGWMGLSQLLTFVQPGHLFRVSPGPSIASVFSNGCVKNLRGDGASAAASAWRGLHAPWQWTLTNFTRDQWRHGSDFHRVVNLQLPQNTIQGDAVLLHASAFLVVSVHFFPESQLAAFGKMFQTRYPITSQGMHVLPP